VSVTGEDTCKLGEAVADFLDQMDPDGGSMTPQGEREQLVGYADRALGFLEVRITWSKGDLSGPEVARLLRQQTESLRAR
jgi:hypothetical protein